MFTVQPKKRDEGKTYTLQLHQVSRITGIPAKRIHKDKRRNAKVNDRINFRKDYN